MVNVQHNRFTLKKFRDIDILEISGLINAETMLLSIAIKIVLNSQ